MTKKTLLYLFLCLLFFNTGTTSVLSKPSLPSIEALLTCDAPAPDSFHVVNAGNDFVTLAWIPAWNGATQTLVTLIENGSGGWTSVSTLNNVTGSSYTASNLHYYSKYRFIIATNCITGEPSTKTAVLDHIVFIIDLSISGRTPLNPTPVTGCNSIDYEANNWVGFKIQTSNGYASSYNYFEFKTEVDGNGLIIPVIKRVIYEGPIYAAGLAPDGNSLKYPTASSPDFLLFGTDKFQLAHYINSSNYIDIGKIEVTLDPSGPHTVRLCPSTSSPWNSGYVFSLLTSQMASGIAPPSNEEREVRGITLPTEVKASSPFEGDLEIFLDSTFQKSEAIYVSLLTCNGSIILRRKFKEINEKISLPTSELASGFYILHLEAENKFKALKVFKK